MLLQKTQMCYFHFLSLFQGTKLLLGAGFPSLGSYCPTFLSRWPLDASGAQEAEKRPFLAICLLPVEDAVQNLLDMSVGESWVSGSCSPFKHAHFWRVGGSLLPQLVLLTSYYSPCNASHRASHCWCHQGEDSVLHGWAKRLMKRKQIWTTWKCAKTHWAASNRHSIWICFLKRASYWLDTHVKRIK